jgi:hypothetical protein
MSRVGLDGVRGRERELTIQVSWGFVCVDRPMFVARRSGPFFCQPHGRSFEKFLLTSHGR